MYDRGGTALRQQAHATRNAGTATSDMYDSKEPLDCGGRVDYMPNRLCLRAP